MMYRVLLLSFCIPVSLNALVTSIVVANHTKNDERIKIRLKGVGEQPEYDLGVVKAGSIGEKKFGNSDTTLCVDYIKVGDLKPGIFEVSAKQYENIMTYKDNPRDITAYFQNNRSALNLMPPKTGACSAFTRRFDIIGNIVNIMDSHPIIITKSIY